uniref:Uncharacterized protein n=1 Tax=Periophthalmus magnuspinnatus TaxID=409849 RepID=A0A3B4B989_9GOBI
IKLQSKQHQDAELLEEISSVFGVWRSIVDATAQAASARLLASEDYRSLTLHTSKSLRNGVEQLQRIQAELLDSLRELQRIKKSYHQLSLIAHTAREKAANAHLIEITSVQMSARLKECDDRLTEVRNQYLLTLAALHAHQQHYYSHDLPTIIGTSTAPVPHRARDTGPCAAGSALQPPGAGEREEAE